MRLLKNMNVIAMIMILGAVITLSSCQKDDGIDGQNGNCTSGIIGQAPIVTETLSVADFSGIDLATVPNVTIKQGTTQEVKAIGYANIIEQLTTSIDNNGVWEINFMQAVCNVNLAIEITLPNLNKLVASSTGNIVVEDFESQNSLSLETSSSGSITVNKFEGITKLAPIISSNGNIKLQQDISTLQTLNANLSSNGDFNAFPVTSEECTVTVSSNGNARVTANNTLNVTISSSGNVYYKGNPTITQNLTSSGQLIDAN